MKEKKKRKKEKNCYWFDAVVISLAGELFFAFSLRRQRKRKSLFLYNFCNYINKYKKILVFAFL